MTTPTRGARDAGVASDEAVREAIRVLDGAYGFFCCEDFHHDKGDRHEFSDPCPVVKRVSAAWDVVRAHSALTAQAAAGPGPAVTDAMVEAAAVAMYDCGSHADSFHDDSAAGLRSMYLRDARAALNAVLAEVTPVDATRTRGGQADG